jgi:hypothetical protein
VQTATDHDAAVMALVPGLEYKAVYVPLSHAPERDGVTEGLNWRIEMRHGAGSIDTTYWQGIGHLPEFAETYLKSRGWKPHSYYKSARHTVDSKRAFDKMMETGIVNGRYLPAPSVADVLYCLLLDGETLDFGTFEEWAENFGYDTDSRKAEVIYRKCLEIGLRLRAMFGDAKLSELREALQDM